MTAKRWFGLKRGGDLFPGSWIVPCAVLMLAAFALAGCSDDDDHDDPPTVYVSEIISDVEADGDIAWTQGGTYIVSSAQDTGNVLAGVDPETGEEYRGFLDFPLRDSDGVPMNAVIESATLEIFISWTSDSDSDRTFPFLIDLIAFQPPILIEDDFDRVVQPPLLTMPIDFYPSDAGAYVVIDVTSLVNEAQMERLVDLQLRFVLDFTETSGLVEIEDSDLETAPLLTISYF